MVTEELRELDRQWAELTGQRWTGGNTVECVLSQMVSRDPAACFGPGGPWEWLDELRSRPSLVPVLSAGWACSVSNWDGNGKPPPPWAGYGATPFEAITRCAIEARTKLEART